MRISAADRKRVEEAIQRAEAETGTDFVCVLSRTASDYEFYPLAWAALLALAAPWVLVFATAWSVVGILSAQLVVFAGALVVLGLPQLRHRLVPRRVQRAAAHRLAAEQFVIRDLAMTPSHRAVLLFLSDGERYARVLAGSGAEAAVSSGHWRTTVALLVGAAREGRHADAFVAALDHCATALRESRPAEGMERTNALPDRFIVLD
jgi:putative membrane protein